MIHIRQERTTDYTSVFEIHLKAFGQKDEALLVDALRNNQDVYVPELSLVAEVDQYITGHILFTKIMIESPSGENHISLALAPMAVLPEEHRKGIGSELIRAGLGKAAQLNFSSVIVLGHEHYYPKFGFKPAALWNIQCPFNVPPEYFMAIELHVNSLKNVSGVVRYPPEFGQV